MFEQSLSGLIKALRASRGDDARVIQQALADIANEVKSSDWELKAGAVLKLTYLEMLGHAHLAQHAFPVIECMSSQKPHIKQIGYLAASQSFMQGTDVILLANNLIKKDLSNNKVLPTELLLTLSSLPPILNSSAQLATDLEPELLRQLSHSKPQVRRSAVLVLGSLWRSAQSDTQREFIIEKLAEKLADQDTSVVGATVNVMLELTKTCEQSDEALTPFLRLAPECFDLLTTSTNNWMLIKIIKWFALLTPVEPRLLRKLLPPITELIQSTAAMSLLYECIHALIAGGMIAEDHNLAQTCITKLASFLRDADQNLRYIALLALIKLLPMHPSMITAHSATILRCVDDPDVSIRSRALELVEGMVNADNLEATVKKLMSHLSPPKSISAAALLTSIASGTTLAPTLANSAYKASLIDIILKITSQSSYGNISDFAWYIDLLFELASISQSLSPTDQKPADVNTIFIDVVARVRGIREYAVTMCIKKVSQNTLVAASAWIIGEYATKPEEYLAAIDALQQAGRVYDATKILAKWSLHLSNTGDWENPETFAGLQGCLDRLLEASQITDPAVHELLGVTRHALESVPTLMEKRKQRTQLQDQNIDNPFANHSTNGNAEADGEEDAGPLGLKILSSIFFSHELNPVNARAQSMVTVPYGLDLDAWIDPGCIPSLPQAAKTDDVDEFGRPKAGFALPVVAAFPDTNGDRLNQDKTKKKRREKTSDADLKEKKKSSKKKVRTNLVNDDDLEAIPVVKIDLSSIKTESRRPAVPMTVDAEGELPVNVVGDRSKENRTVDAPSIIQSSIEMPTSQQHPEVQSAQPIAVTKVKAKKSKTKSTSKKHKESTETPS